MLLIPDINIMTPHDSKNDKIGALCQNIGASQFQSSIVINPHKLTAKRKNIIAIRHPDNVSDHP